ncbi:odorant receptor 131-2-like [Erpetoichthys calabaricus]|uniref:odorant receptor 131-2-like n=1 Tax=Erpetoichthys calabaricus TaxID=27687 RepID=UPI002234A57A|nr:odorant receptor 131-2-like [Erpetoichthys calabaricus]
MHIWREIALIMPVSFCYLLMTFAIATNYNTPLNLALMALERYIAICKPLHHPNICTVRRTYVILSIMWLISYLSPASDIIITITIEPMSFFSTNIICENDSLIRTYSQSVKRNYLSIIFFAVAWLTMVYTYINIVTVAQSASRSEKSSAKKAYNTVLLHAIQLTLSSLMFLVPIVNNVWLHFQNVELGDVQYYTHILIILFPRLLSPLIYGVREENFRKYLKGYVTCGAITKDQNRQCQRIK